MIAGSAAYDSAQAEAEAQSLDFLDVVQPDQTIIWSAHWPARFGYKNDWDVDRMIGPPRGELMISADRDQLHRALRNLVLNAMDAMPNGGALRVATARETGGVRISVTDSGAGLTAEECARLFTPYYTTKQHGTGLGLAIVQSVVSDHGGKISVLSEAGHGATFIIDLPNGDTI
jgi:signal transduction histidine kinase